MQKTLKIVVSVFLLFLVASSAAASEASASRPETPTISVGQASSSGTTLFGVVNPGASKPTEGGTYQFVYSPSTIGKCKGPEQVELPSSPGFTGGLEHEEVLPEAVAGLSPATEYAACLVVTEPSKTEPAVSAAASFKTRKALEQPETLPPSGVTSNSAQLRAVLNPHAAGEEGEFYNFVYQQESSECRGENEVSVPAGPVAASAAQADHVEVEAERLLPDTKYTYCVLASTEFGEFALGEPVTFTTPTGGPEVSDVSVGDVQATEATLTATVDPNGNSTTVEIGGPGISTTVKTLPASKQPVSVQQKFVGLSSGTHYTIKLLAVNEVGRREAEASFMTPGVISHERENCPNRNAQGFSSRLPDCRAVEPVSPQNEAGDVYDPGGEPKGNAEEDIDSRRPFRASADGNRVAYLGDPGLVGGDGSTAKGHGNEFWASRGASGWTTTNITPSVSEGEESNAGREYTYLSSDLGAGVVLSQAPLLGSSPDPQAPENCAALYGVGTEVAPAAFSSLFTTTLSPAFCGTPGGPQGNDSTLFFAGETPGHTLKVFDSDAALVAPAVPSSGVGGDIYASSPGGALTVVNVLPNGSVEPAAVAGGPSRLPDNGPNLLNVVAPSGKQVIWSSVASKESVREAKAAFPKALYAREDPLSAQAQTIELDEAASGAPGPSGEGQYWASAAGGNDVFFTDCHKLTAQSTAHDEEGCQHLSNFGNLVETGSDLYLYDFSRAPGERLIDLTIDHAPGDALGADVQGVIGTSEDGTFVYFVAGGTLGAGPNASGEAPHAGKCETPPEGPLAEQEGHVPAGFGCNLFELHFNGTAWEAPVFIAALGANDDQVTYSINDPEKVGGELAGDWIPRLGSRTAEVTPNGGALVFSSTQELTGYDVAAAGRAPETNEQGANEIFLFSAANKSLTCVSCDPLNRPPDIQTMQRAGETYVPVSSSDTFMHRWVNSEGTEVFFDSSQPLSEEDFNKTQDVYEWTAPGTSSCPTSTSTYGGCVFLLTSGESEVFSFLVDIDESGANAFVVHRGPLYGVGQAGGKSELYDLRVLGGQTIVGQGCAALATCPALPVPAPVAATPGSSEISGSDNFAPARKVTPAKLTAAQIRAARLRKALSACKKAHRKSPQKRKACEKAARRRYAPVKKASHK